jgi:hypothetical protein
MANVLIEKWLEVMRAGTPEIHKNTLVSFEMMFGSVITTDAVIEKVKKNL